MKIAIKMRYFALLREELGIEGEVLELPEGSRVSDLKSLLLERYPALVELMPYLKVAMNLQFVDEERALEHEAEIALIPPVAGGAPLARVVREPIRLDELLKLVSRPEFGAIVTFVGTVRDNNRNLAVTQLEYEAYEEMAVAAMDRICVQAQTRWPGCAAFVDHRIGLLAVGDAAIAIVVGAPHRAAAFEACRMIIDEIKQEVPIWKREFGPEGASWVFEPDEQVQSNLNR